MSSDTIKSIKLATGSKLQVIDKNAFNECPIESICLPASVTRIGKFAFYSCKNLKRIEFTSDSKLQVIDKGAFVDCPIESLSIPASLIELKVCWCDGVS